MTVFIVEYMAVGLFQESYVVSCGVQKVVERLAEPLDHIHLETQINTIQSNKHNPEHRFEIIDEHGVSYDIDHIIFATQGNQACHLIEEYIESLKNDSSPFEEWKVSQEPIITCAQQQMDMLHTFNYDTALVINHTDARLLPSNPSNWKALNLAIVDKSVDPGDSDLIVPYPHDTTMATHILNYTHNGIKMEEKEKQTIYMQTTNPCISVDPKKVLSVAWFERATVTLESKKALEKLFVFNQDTQEYELGPCQGTNNIWFVGSYCWKGIPLLEGCVASAEYVVTKGIANAEHIKISVPY
jgi:predicted NAD/FAD-binding protein